MPRLGASVLSAKRSTAVPALTEVILNEPSAEVFATATGNIIGTLQGDSAPRTWPIIQGVVYPMSFKSFDATSPTACIALFNT